MVMTSQLATPCWRDPTSRNSCPRLQCGFQFGLYRVVTSLSFLRSISLASLFTSLSIFCWSDLLQILRRPAAFSLAVLCIIMFNQDPVFLGVAWSVPILKQHIIFWCDCSAQISKCYFADQSFGVVYCQLFLKFSRLATSRPHEFQGRINKTKDLSESLKI